MPEGEIKVDDHKISPPKRSEMKVCRLLLVTSAYYNANSNQWRHWLITSSCSQKVIRYHLAVFILPLKLLRWAVYQYYEGSREPWEAISQHISRCWSRVLFSLKFSISSMSNVNCRYTHSGVYLNRDYLNFHFYNTKLSDILIDIRKIMLP